MAELDKSQVIQVLKSYKSIAKLLEKLDHVAIFDEVIKYINNSDIQTKSLNKETASSKSKSCYGESDFLLITSQGDPDLTSYCINPDIISNKHNILPFWKSLKTEEKAKCTPFEMNLILYYITDKNPKYLSFPKKKMISHIDNIASCKSKEPSYKGIIA